MFPFRRVCTMQAGAALIWGLILVAAPGLVLGTLLGMMATPETLTVGRFAGGMMFALGGTLVACRDLEEDGLRARIAFANAACDLAMAAVLGWAFSQGLTQGFVAGMVVFFFGLNTVSWLGTRLS